MAEFSEVIRHFKRLCTTSDCNTCCLKCDKMGCITMSHEDPKEFERRVMWWASAHPEPQYPTWVEWFNSMGGVDCGERIPADIAEKLGIKPKEGRA